MVVATSDTVSDEFTATLVPLILIFAVPANEGLEVWSKLTPNQRSRYLFKIARLIQERSREFAVLESLDGGKPIKESRDFDLPQVAANFFYFAGWADKLDLSWATKSLKPYGVVGQIIPWNFPL